MDFVAHNISSFASILSIWTLAVVMPGPDMFLVIRTAVSSGFFSSILAVFGIVAGTLIWLVVGFFLIGLLSSGEILEWFKLIGGSYLIWMAFRLFSSLKSPASNEWSKSSSIGFYAGFLTNLSNPKPPVFISIILSNLPPLTPIWIDFGLLVIMLLVPLVWFYFVIRLFTIPAFLKKFMHYRKVLDFLVALVFVLFGLNLIFESISFVISHYL